MNLVYGSSSSLYMDCMVFFGDVCCISRRSGVRFTPCSCIGTSVAGLVIFGNSFCGSTTFRMSTRRLPVLLFVSRIEYPFISCCFVAWSAYGGLRGFYVICVLWHASKLGLLPSLLIILLLPPPWALRQCLPLAFMLRVFSRLLLS